MPGLDLLIIGYGMLAGNWMMNPFRGRVDMKNCIGFAMCHMCFRNIHCKECA